MRSRSPSNWAQYASRPIPKTPTRARGAGRGSRPARSMAELVVVMGRLEVELADVLLVERRQGPEHDLAVLADRVLAQAAGLELLARLAGDLARRERGCRVAREVADVLRHPELELVDGPVPDELAH